MKEKSLTPDELGEKGESHFKVLCADAKLICNKSDRDRAGWDFIVDFPFKNQDTSSFDKRLAPSSCHLQVKTVYASTKSVKLKLNMAERLAKELKPSFICVIKVNDDLSIAETYLIHLLGDRLGLILKRLRKESANGTPITNLNKNFIYFSPRQSERIDPTGFALREYLEVACGPSLQKYVQEKSRELSSLGFDGARHEVKLTLAASSQNELADIFLGLRKSVPVNNLETFETRFGIKIPDLPPQKASITIAPHPFDQCKVVVHGEDSLPPSVFTADVFFLPVFLSGAEKRIHLRSHLFCIDLFISDAGVMPQFKFDISSKRAIPEVWWSYWRLLRAFHENRGHIEIASIKTKQIIEFDIRCAENMEAYSFDFHLELCDALSRIFRYAGFGRAPEFEWISIETQSQSIAFADQIIQGYSSPLSFTVDSNKDLNILDGARGILTNRLTIENHSFAYYALVDVDIENNNSKNVLKISNFLFRRGLLLTQREEDFNQFVEDAKHREHIDLYLSLAART
jgi:hypothetical protein